jgi:hypothetical protein
VEWYDFGIPHVDIIDITRNIFCVKCIVRHNVQMIKIADTRRIF